MKEKSQVGETMVSFANGENLSVESLVEKLMAIEVKKAAKFLIDNGVVFPRTIRMNVLREVLRPGIVKTRNESLTLDSRLNYRLLWFNIFSEEQMVFFIPTFDTEYLAEKYLKELYKAIILELDEHYKEGLESFFNFVNADDSAYEKISMLEIHNLFNDIFVDNDGEIDGLLVDDFRPIMFSSATVAQLNAIGQKFGFEVPQTLKKDVLPKYISIVINSINPSANVNEEDFAEMTVKQMKDFAKEHGVEIGMSLNKMQVIEYILMNCKTTKDGYKVPESDSVYEMAIPITEAETKFDEIVVERDRIESEMLALRNQLETVNEEEKARIEAEIEERAKELAAQDEELKLAKEAIENANAQAKEAESALDEALKEKEALKALVKELEEKLSKKEALKVDNYNAIDRKDIKPKKAKVVVAEKTSVKLGEDEYEIKEIVSNLWAANPNEVVKILQKANTKIDRLVRMNVLREVLRPGIVKTRNESLTLDSRLNYRLLWFNIFSEEQMVFFIPTFDTPILLERYAKDLYKAVIVELEEANQAALGDLIEYAYNAKVATYDDREDLTLNSFHNIFNPIFFDNFDVIDGLTSDEFRPIMYNSATIAQLNLIGPKYGFEVPQSLKKDVLPKYIATVIKSINKDADVSEETFADMTVSEMKNFAKGYGVEVGTSLNKMQVIEYILMNCATTRGSYKAPESDAVYEMAIPITEAESKFDELVVERDRINTELIFLQGQLDSVAGAERAKIEAEIAEKERALESQDEELRQAKQDIEDAKQEKDEANKSLEEALLKIQELEKALAEKPATETVYVEKFVEGKGQAGAIDNEVLEKIKQRMDYLEHLIMTQEKTVVIAKEGKSEDKEDVVIEHYEDRPISRALKIGIFFGSLIGVGLCVFGVVMLALLLAGVIG